MLDGSLGVGGGGEQTYSSGAARLSQGECVNVE
jgi:hypothetical protein